jgi:Lon protease-like protein
MAPYKPPARDLARALSALPLLPYAQAVLFPGVRLGLEICEPLQLRLVRDVLRSHRALGLVHPASAETPVSGTAAGQQPPLAEVAGVGTIVEHAERSSGRCRVVLLGRARVRLRELSFRPPFRRAEATVLPSLDTVPSAAELASLHRAAQRFAAVFKDRGSVGRLRLPADSDPGATADAYAHALVVDARQQQAVLEALDVRARVLRVTELLTVQLKVLNGGSDDGVGELH